jgi:serine O-acetyltransferase
MQIKNKQELAQLIEADIYRYTGKKGRKARRTVWGNPAVRFCYHLRKSMYAATRNRLLYFYYAWRRNAAGRLCGAEISAHGGSIGPGLHLAHNGGIVIHCDAVLGSNVTVSTGVVIGQQIKNGLSLCPVIGDNVYIAPGAKLIGGIHIGNDVAIGANAVVTKDVPDHAVVAGVPAKILGYGGAREYLLHPY